MNWFTDNLLGVISMVVTGLTAFAGGVWWMSALYSEVKRINKTLSEVMVSQKQTNLRVWKAIDGLDHRVDQQEQRIIKVETKLDAR